MSRFRPFTDNAGYTRHCWECVHSKDWVRDLSGHYARCEITGACVERYDSPNNPCCHLPNECRYEVNE